MKSYDASALEREAGSTLGTSGWFTVTQDRIDLFADATGDRQWIHVDPVRAAEGPFSATVAHGYLTLSMIPIFLADVYALEGVSSVLNYGLDRVRFPHPVVVDSRVRGRVTLNGVEPTPSGRRVRFEVVVEIEGVDKPACVATVLHLLSLSPLDQRSAGDEGCGRR